MQSKSSITLIFTILLQLCHCGKVIEIDVVLDLLFFFFE